METKGDVKVVYMNILQIIRDEYATMTAKEKQIANYILQNSSTINRINIVDMAREVGVSSGTITRFCKKIKCNNFVDMKFRINLLENGEDRFGGNPVLDEAYSFYSKIILNTRNDLNMQELQKVADILQGARNIYLYGVGSSGLSAQAMGTRMLRMGMNAKAINESHMMMINSAITTQDDVVVGISNMGNTHEVAQALQLSRNNGAAIITITSFANTPVSDCGHHRLYVYNSNFTDNKRFVNSQVGIMYLLDVLSMILLENPEFSQKMQRTTAAITEGDGAGS